MVLDLDLNRNSHLLRATGSEIKIKIKIRIRKRKPQLKKRTCPPCRRTWNGQQAKRQVGPRDPGKFIFWFKTGDFPFSCAPIISERSDLLGFSRIWSQKPGFPSLLPGLSRAGKKGRQIVHARQRRCPAGRPKAELSFRAPKRLARRRGGGLPTSDLRIPRSGMSFRHSRGDYGTSRNGQKTFHRFLGTIFFGGVGGTLVVEGQWLATGKNTKNRKNSKKSAK